MSRWLIKAVILTALLMAAWARAAEETAEDPAEYVVAVAKLNLRAEPSPKADVIAVLTYGERVAATGAKPAYVKEGEGWDLITDFWYEVRAGDKKGWLAGRYILSAEVFDAAEKADELDETGEAYVVWVAKLNLRRNPGTGAEKLTTLAAGTTVADAGCRVVPLEDDLWRLVRAGDKVGWVADRYVLPGRLYEAFKKADELGKAGRGKAMVAAALDGGRKLQFDEYDRVMRKRFYDVSPDGLKVIVAGYWSMEGASDWGGGYPYGMREGNGFPVLYFVSGRGLVEYFRSYQEVSGIWSPDSRYYAYVERSIVEWGFENPLKLLDVESWKRTEVGWCVPGRPDGPYYAFADGYLVWVTAEPVKGFAHPAITEKTLAPVLVGYDISTGKKFRVLEADMATLKKDTARRQFDIAPEYGGNYYVVKMSPALSCPAVIKNSEIYKTYNGSYPRVINRDEFSLYFW